MPGDQLSALQLHLFASDSPAYQDALARYKAIRPILKQERTLAQHRRATGLNYWQLWRDLRRFRRDGLLGLINRRQLPHPWGKTSVEELLPRHIQQHIVQLAIAHPFTDRELARMVRSPADAEVAVGDQIVDAHLAHRAEGVAARVLMRVHPQEFGGADDPSQRHG